MQQWWQTAQTVEVVPYSEFEQLLAQDKIAEVTVSDTRITGKLKAPENGKTVAVANLVPPQVDFAGGRRHGHGVYRWPTGDVYAGPWREDVAVGPATPMMRAQAKFREEARAAVARPGQAVCRAEPVGIAQRDWVRGVIVAANDDQVAVRIDDLGSGANALAAQVRPGDTLWDDPRAWTPCFFSP